MRIEKWVYGGSGLGRLNGRVVLTPFVLPGETARVEPVPVKKDLMRARLVSVGEAAPERVTPACPYFERCGGCHYQHAPYEFQLERKKEILAEVLRRVGRIEPPRQIGVVAGPPWEYRNRAQFHLDHGEIGYREAGSHRLCPVTRCPISSPRINEGLAALRRMIRQPRFPQFLRSIELFTNETDLQVNVLEAGGRLARTFFEWLGAQFPGVLAPALDFRAAGELYRVTHGSFFQANRFLLDDLVKEALWAAEGESALDLYAGVGLFTLPLARRISSVTAVESGSSACRDVEFNASRAGLAVDTKHASVEDYLESCSQPPDFVMADPPRTGLGRAVAGHLVRLRPRRLTLVSCDPPTLARDLAPLAAAGYRIGRMTMVDLFPQTFHIEAVVHLTTDGPGGRLGV